MIRLPAALITMLALGCQPKQAPMTFAERAATLDYAVVPTLPAPSAQSYMSARGTPLDPVIAALTDGKNYNLNLAAAAASLALDLSENQGSVDRWSLREALWQGGYMYPALEARSWHGVQAGPPGPDVINWLESLPEDAPMALVRSRGEKSDVWVAIWGQPQIDLGIQPRVTSVGNRFRLPEVAGATYQLADPAGEVTEGALSKPTDLVLSTTGEWLAYVHKDGEELARFPIYVGIESPGTKLLDNADAIDVVDAASAGRRARALLTEIRKMYYLAPWSDDPLMDAAARAWTSEGPQRSVQIIQGVGYDPRKAVIWECRDTTVENCIDTWVWDPTRRADLLDPNGGLLGLHVELSVQGIRMTAALLRGE